MEILEDNKIICSHCGDECRDNLIKREDLNFCCEGCNIVHQILEDNNMEGAYERPDLLARKTRRISEYDYLENEEVVKKMVHFTNDTYKKVILNLPAIHCSACIVVLENLPKFLPGVSRADVNFNKKELTILYRWQELSLKDIAEFLHDLGYKPDFSFSTLENKKAKKNFNKDIGMRIAVAGFCFGNSMLISLPEYLDTNFHLEEKYKVLFGIVNLILILPVVFYSGSGYFTSAVKGLRKRQVNLDVPIALGIAVLFIRTTYEITFQTGVGYADSLTGLVFFLLLGRWYQNKTYQALAFDRDYKSFFPISVTKMILGQEKNIPLSQVEPGDELLIRNNELIPVDSKLKEGEGSINYSFVTGESLPENVKPGEDIYAGGKHLGPPIIIEALKTVDNSYLTQLWQHQKEEQKEDPSLTLIINKISKHFTIAILTIAFLTAAYWLAVDVDKLWISFSSVLIVACPCALALASPFAYGHAMRLLGKTNIYLKDATVVEKLAHIEHIVWDKTGTLTNNFNSQTNFIGEPLSTSESELIKAATHNSMHPLSRQIFQSLGNLHVPTIDQYKEHTGKGIEASIENNTIKIGSASFVGTTWNDQNNESRVYISFNGKIRGYYSFKQHYRSGIFDVLKRLKEKFILHVLSGDNNSEKENLKPYFKELHFNQNPSDKKEYLKNLNSEEVLMIGDGLNDSGALTEAKVGIAVTDDIHQFTPACDAIYKAEELPAIDKHLAFARRTLKIVYIAFGISFLYNVIGLSFAVTGNLTPLFSAILMPISSVTVVLFVSIGVMSSFNRIVKNPQKVMTKVIAPPAYSHDN